MQNLTLKKVKDYTNANGKSVVYNRTLGGYQVTDGFSSSELVYPSIVSGRAYWTQGDLRKLLNLV